MAYKKFSVPQRSAGKDFVMEMSKLFRAYAEGSALQAIAMKAITSHVHFGPTETFSHIQTKGPTFLSGETYDYLGDINNLVLERRSL